MVECDGDVPARIVRCVPMPLVHADTVDLRPDHRAIGNVEIPQGLWSAVAGPPAVLIKEVVAETLSTEELQIHGQKCSVIEAVDIPQVIVELQTVEQLRPIGHAEDVVGEQICVTVDDTSLCDALGKQRTAARDELGGQSCHFNKGLRRDDCAGMSLQFEQVLVPSRRGGAVAALGVDDTATYC